MPVVSPVATDADDSNGAGLNVNGDDAAAAIAAALGAEELVFVADVAGVMDGGMVVPRLTQDDAAALVQRGTAAGGMAAKLEAGFAALAAGVARVRIAGLDALTDQARGTSLLTPTAAPWQR
jgi:acetylglutamate kinase